MLSYNVKLIVEPEGREHLLHMLGQHAKAWNFISEDTFKNSNIEGKIIYDRNYYKCRKNIDGILSQVVIRALNSVTSTFHTIKKNGDLDKLTKAPVNTNLSIRLDKRLYRFLPGNRISISTSAGRVECSFSPWSLLKDKLETSVPHDPLIFVRGGDIYLSLSFDATGPMFIEDKIIGVDLGIRRMAVTSEGIAYSDKNYLKQRRKIRHLKRQLQGRKDLWGSNSAARHLIKANRKERNQSRNLLHHLANAILETAATTIVLEDLTNIKENTKKRPGKRTIRKREQEKRFNNRQGQVPYFGLRQMLTWKAPLLGKRVETVNPAYTSSNDCRGLAYGRRQGCRYYGSDGKVLDADGNAAVNILRKYCARRKLPLSYELPGDGSLYFRGRLTSTSRIPEAVLSTVGGQAHDFSRG